MATQPVMIKVWIGAAAVSAIALAGSFSPASAAIACKDGYQRVQGNYIATPYCPNYKRQVCLTVGNDIRVQEICRTVNPTIRGRPY